MSSLHNWDQREEQQVGGWADSPGYIELLEADYGATSSKRHLSCRHERIMSLLTQRGDSRCKPS
jgi:hypothetical protein